MYYYLVNLTQKNFEEDNFLNNLYDFSSVSIYRNNELEALLKYFIVVTLYSKSDSKTLTIMIFMNNLFL